jgi:hypothetical protein
MPALNHLVLRSETAAPDLSSLFISCSAPSSAFAAATLLPDYANRDISWKYDKI